MQFSCLFPIWERNMVLCCNYNIHIYKRSCSNNVDNPWYGEQIFYFGKVEDHTSKKKPAHGHLSALYRSFLGNSAGICSVFSIHI